MGDDLCANGLQAVALIRVLQYFDGVPSTLGIAPCRLKVRLRSFDDVGFMSGFPPKTEIGEAIYEYTP